MNYDLIYCCKLRDESENQNLAVELLSSLELSFSSWYNKEENTSFHTVYCDDKNHANTICQKLHSLKTTWNAIGAKIVSVETLELKREDWTEVWKKYFNIIQISPQLAVKPSWLEYTPQPQQQVIEIDPGMSFGTGQHATTSFCLKMLDKLSPFAIDCNFLDIGCGSGILSIAAHKLNIKSITAFDFDSEAVRIATDNFHKNNIPDATISLSTSTVKEFADNNHKQYNLVAANMLGHILRENCEYIASLVKAGGKLMLAGMLSEQFDETIQLFLQRNFRLTYSADEREWTGGLLEKF